MLTQLKFSPEQITAQSAATAAALQATIPGADPARYAAQIIAQRLRLFPLSYLEFGPYWWTVKAALFAQGEDFGPAFDGSVLAAYGGGLSALSALVAGEMFKDYYRATYLAGAAQFMLDDESDEAYVLFDSNMEARRLGPGAIAVAANLDALPLDPEKEPENTEPGGGAVATT